MIHDLIEGGIAILVLAGLLAVAAWGVTRLLPSRRGERAGSADEILRERFARGEISAEEYVKAYQVLLRDSVPEELRRLRAGPHGSAETRAGYELVAIRGFCGGDGLLPSWTPRYE